MRFYDYIFNLLFLVISFLHFRWFVVVLDVHVHVRWFLVLIQNILAELLTGTLQVRSSSASLVVEVSLFLLVLTFPTSLVYNIDIVVIFWTIFNTFVQLILQNWHGLEFVVGKRLIGLQLLLLLCTLQQVCLVVRMQLLV